MKIGVISTAAIPTPPERYGGIERIAWWLCCALSQMQHNVTLFAKEGSKAPPGGKLEAVTLSERQFAHAFAAGEWHKRLDALIDMSHDKVIPRLWPNFPSINVYQVMSLSWPHNVVCISYAQRRHLKMEEAKVIYYGIRAGEYPLYLGEREDYLLYMGSVIPEKQAHIAIDVAKRCRHKLIICGPAWVPEYFRNAIKPHLDSDKIIYMGDVGGQQKLELIMRAKALIHPVGGTGWVEAGAIIVLEALHCGTPVLASDNGCLPEYIQSGRNGYICYSLDDYAYALSHIDEINPYECRRSVSWFNHWRMAGEYIKLAEKVKAGLVW